LGFLLLTVFLTSVIIFSVTQWLPGDVCRVILGREAGESALLECRQELGLDESLPVQYLSWLGNFLSGDWGQSFSTKSEIFPVVMGRLRNTLLLTIVTLVIAVPLAVGLGVIAVLITQSIFFPCRWLDCRSL
jgi:peptide/nickel transport system permease protein